MRAVFLHGLWRSGSTYLWNCFRRAENSYCYYEPLNASLARLTRKRLSKQSQEDFFYNNHPSLKRPYFDEFTPFIKRLGRGVRGFSSAFEAKHIILNENASHDALESYIQMLMSEALGRGKIPVFGFNRTNFRIGWLAKRFPDAKHVYIQRSAYDIWRSYEKHRRIGNYTFFTAWLYTLECNKNDPVLSPLVSRLTLRQQHERIFRKKKSFYRNVIQSMSPEETYFMVYYLWCIAKTQAEKNNVLIFDMQKGQDKSYVDGFIKNIKNITDLSIHMNDIRGSSSQHDVIANKEEIEKSALLLLRNINNS